MRCNIYYPFLIGSQNRLIIIYTNTYLSLLYNPFYLKYVCTYNSISLVTQFLDTDVDVDNLLLGLALLNYLD